MATAMMTLKHVKDPHYISQHRERSQELLKGANVDMLLKKFEINARQPRPYDDDSQSMNQKLLGELFTTPYAPQIEKAILDSTGSYTSGGSVFIRQDLEPIVHALFVQMFPFFEMAPKGESNGLAHVANQIIATDSNAVGATIMTETGSVNYVAGTYARVSYPIAIFGTGRGVTFKEMAAVRAGGGVVQPLQTEMRNGMTALARDVQFTMFQGNATNASGTAVQEAGGYNANAFDGLRGVIGSAGSWSANNAIQLDQGALNLTESLKAGAARVGDNGGFATTVLCSKKAKDAIDAENGGNRRYGDDQVEVVAGVRVNKIAAVDTDLNLIPCPGSTIGTYNRTSDGAICEDLYVLDMNHITLRWLYSETFTVLEIPSGVDGVLSSRYIVFGMFGLEQAAPLFTAKVRRIAA